MPYEPDDFFYGDADYEAAEFHDAARTYHARIKRSRQLRKRGDLVGAAHSCPHGWVYPLKSLAAEHEKDPRKGEDGIRCLDCGSVLSADKSRVLFACEKSRETVSDNTKGWNR